MLDSYFSDFCRWLERGDREPMERYLADLSDAPALAVYRNGFLRTCVEALSSNYPSIRLIVGDQNFRALARGYVDRHPPEQTTLVGYGDLFPDYIGDCVGEHQLEYLPDLAALDQGWLHALWASDAEPAGSDMLSVVGDISSLRLKLNPTVRLVDTRFAVWPLWQALREQRPMADAQEVECGHNVTMFWREHDTVFSRPLTAAEVTFLRRTETCTLGEAAEAALDCDRHFDIEGHFAALIQHGLLTCPTNEGEGA